MSSRPLLVELFTEELPPKALPKLGQAFAQGLHDALQTFGLIEATCTIEPFATPRRLGVRLSAVLAVAPDQSFSEKLMPVKVGLDASGVAKGSTEQFTSVSPSVCRASCRPCAKA